MMLSVTVHESNERTRPKVWVVFAPCNLAQLFHNLFQDLP